MSDHLTVCIYKMYLQIIYLIYMALNNQQWLICHKPNQTKPNIYPVKNCQLLNERISIILPTITFFYIRQRYLLNIYI